MSSKLVVWKYPSERALGAQSLSPPPLSTGLKLSSLPTQMSVGAGLRERTKRVTAVSPSVALSMVLGTVRRLTFLVSFFMVASLLPRSHGFFTVAIIRRVLILGISLLAILWTISKTWPSRVGLTGDERRIVPKVTPTTKPTRAGTVVGATARPAASNASSPGKPPTPSAGPSASTSVAGNSYPVNDGSYTR